MAASVAASALNLRAPRTWSGRCMRNRGTPAGFKPNQPKTDGPTGGLTYPLNASKSCRKPSKTHLLGSHKIGTKSSRTDGWKHFQTAGFEKAKAQKDRGRNLRTQTAQNWNLRTPRQHTCHWNQFTTHQQAKHEEFRPTWSDKGPWTTHIGRKKHTRSQHTTKGSLKPVCNSSELPLKSVCTSPTSRTRGFAPSQTPPPHLPQQGVGGYIIPGTMSSISGASAKTQGSEYALCCRSCRLYPKGWGRGQRLSHLLGGSSQIGSG